MGEATGKVGASLPQVVLVPRLYPRLYIAILSKKPDDKPWDFVATGFFFTRDDQSICSSGLARIVMLRSGSDFGCPDQQ